MARQIRQIVAGAVSVPKAFEVVGFDEKVKISLRAPDGGTVEIPLELTQFEDIDEFESNMDKFVEATEKLEEDINVTREVN